MILCEFASQSVSLSYSVIKFLRFDGFAWEGTSLPLWLSPLGDLHSLELELQDERGKRLRGARWDEGLLFGPFERNHKYSLTMRLEFQPPFQLEQFPSDFQSIHPTRYQVSLAFPKARAAENLLDIQLGEQAWRIPLSRQMSTNLGELLEIRLDEDPEHFHFQASSTSPVPYSHQAFPVLRLPGWRN